MSVRDIEDNKTRLSYWFPVIERAGLPVPKTEIIKASQDDFALLLNTLDSGCFPAESELAMSVAEAGKKMGEPFFLRTDHFSGKHGWDRNCFVENAKNAHEHIFSIAEMWEMSNFAPPPADTWIVREILETIPYGVCSRYGNMPICKEFRVFVKGEQVLCVHPYWPFDSLERGKAQFYDGLFNYTEFCDPGNDLSYLKELASKAGKALGGDWSVDFLETKKGWYLIDMAEAHRSFHWPGCPFA